VCRFCRMLRAWVWMHMSIRVTGHAGMCKFCDYDSDLLAIIIAHEAAHSLAHHMDERIASKALGIVVGLQLSALAMWRGVDKVISRCVSPTVYCTDANVLFSGCRAIVSKACVT
jgi:predicted Zn-dependent protease